MHTHIRTCHTYTHILTYTNIQTLKCCPVESQNFMMCPVYLDGGETLADDDCTHARTHTHSHAPSQTSLDLSPILKQLAGKSKSRGAAGLSRPGGRSAVAWYWQGTTRGGGEWAGGKRHQARASFVIDLA